MWGPTKQTMNTILEERKQRIELFLKELRYELVDGEDLDESYSATFQDASEIMLSYFIDQQSNFMELSFVFSFSPDFQDYLRDRMEELLQICYEFGVYTNMINGRDEIIISVFSKIYYSGLNYYIMKDTLKDFKDAIYNLTQLLDIRREGTSPIEN